MFMEVQRTSVLMREAASTSELLVPIRCRTSQEYHPITHHLKNLGLITFTELGN